MYTQRDAKYQETTMQRKRREYVERMQQEEEMVIEAGESRSEAILNILGWGFGMTTMFGLFYFLYCLLWTMK